MGNVKVFKPNSDSEHVISQFSTPNGGVSGTVTFKESIVLQGLLAALGEGDIPDFDPSIKLKAGVASLPGISGISISSQAQSNNFDFTHTIGLAGVNGAGAEFKIVTNRDGNIISTSGETGIRAIHGAHATFLGVPIGAVGDMHAGVIISNDGEIDLTGGLSVDFGLVFGNINGSLDVSGSDLLLDIRQFDVEGGCFLAGTEISMWDGTKKPIEEIREGDLVTSYDDNGKLVPRPVTRTMTHRVKHILDVHGLMVTPGHVTLCGGGRFDGQHVPMIDILRSDGALVKEDGTKVRAGTNEIVGSSRDQLVHVISGERDANGTFTPRERGEIRLGTRFIYEDENGDSYVACIADIIERAGGIIRSDGMIEREPGGEGMPYLWPNGPLLPHPEDYVLQRSKLTLNDIYAAGEWEAVQPQMPPPPSAEALPVKGPEGLMANPANAIGALPRQGASPGKPMTRQQLRAAQAKERKATKARKRMALS